MTKPSKSFFFVLMILLTSVSVSMGTDIDSLSSLESNIVKKPVLDTNIIHKFNLDPDFQYQKQLLKKSPFGEIWSDVKNAIIRFIIKLLDDIFGFKVSETSSNVIFWILILIVIVCLFLFLWKFKKQMLTNSGSIISESLEINQGKIDYMEEYNKSYQNQDYRGAIRFILLNTLKKLDDQNKILFVSGKTLYEYQSEIKSDELRGKFSEICNVYEYIFFGNFDATKSLCDLVYSNMDIIFNLKSTV